MFRFSSKIIVSIVLCITLTINSFAINTTVDSVKIDGIVTSKEWGDNSSVCILKGGEDSWFSMAQLFIVMDLKKSEICVGVRVAEKKDVGDKSSVRMVFDGNTVTGWANGQSSDSNYLLKEFGVCNVSNESYSLEARFIYPQLSKSTNFSIAFVDSAGRQSSEYYIDLNKMALKQDEEDEQTKKDDTTTSKKPPKTTKEATTKEQTKKETTKTKESQSSKTALESQKIKSKSGKPQTKSSNSINQGKNGNTATQSNMAGVLADNINQGKDKTGYKKIAGTAVALSLLITAIVLPIRKAREDSVSKDTTDK
ncbi:MAG: hypothetical protein WBK75_07540 [Acutalibacteraceae bacterium]